MMKKALICIAVLLCVNILLRKRGGNGGEKFNSLFPYNWLSVLVCALFFEEKERWKGTDKAYG